MARRPAHLPCDSMSKAEMDELQRSLSLLSPDIVKGRYKAVLDRCRFLELATPRMMQELVTLWRVLWYWRK
ncbi:MAG TPA: hypothetical protein VGF19_00130 [Candidatus Acidoferrum sp.]